MLEKTARVTTKHRNVIICQIVLRQFLMRNWGPGAIMEEGVTTPAKYAEVQQDPGVQFILCRKGKAIIPNGIAPLPLLM